MAFESACSTVIGWKPKCGREGVETEEEKEEEKMEVYSGL